MSDFIFPCSQCGQHIQYDDGYVGCQINCPTCQASIIVPPTANGPAVAGKSGAGIWRTVLISLAVLVACAGLAGGGWYLYAKHQANGNWGFDSLTGCSLLLPLHGNMNDSSGNGNNFSSSGGVTLNTTYATFDGSSGYLSHVAIPFMAGDFTVSIWVYISGGTGCQKIIGNLWDYHDGRGEWSLDYQNGSVYWNIYGNSGWVWLGQSMASMSQNAWHMLTVTKSGSNFTLYIDGSSSWSGVSSDSFNDSGFSNQMHLACCLNTPGIPEHFLTGNLSMAALFTRALSPTEISHAYAKQHP
jgi:DNA-directed RNA polymerase subunit RPC12/RpoP